MTEALKILIVDDDPVIRTLLRNYLVTRYNVSCAENGAEALEVVRQAGGELQLVLSDIEMPGLDGLGLLKCLRAEFPDIGVIMISGSADTRIAITAIRQGAYDYITKPIDELDEVDITIQRWQNQQSLETKLARYAMLHREMMKSMKTRTFLAVDVAESGKIKQGEDPFISQFVFQAYQNYIESIVRENHGAVQGTSGDGAMACFVNAADAVAAARQILSELETFNSKQNQLGRKFRLRIGVHTGQVMVNKDGKINEMFAESLDIAGHIQKNSSENTLSISEATLQQLDNPSGFNSSDKQVDGTRLFELKTVY
jgi:CheY-like chemotaxis protein